MEGGCKGPFSCLVVPLTDSSMNLMSTTSTRETLTVAHVSPELSIRAYRVSEPPAS